MNVESYDEALNSFDDVYSLAVQSSTKKHAISPLLIAQSAAQHGASISWWGRYMFSASLDGIEVFFWDVRSNEAAVAARIATNKNLTRRFVEHAGVPMADGKVVKTAEEAVAFWHARQRPIVLKPAKGTGGRGVSLNLDDTESIEWAYRRAESGGRAIAEVYVQGQECRLMLVGGEVVAVLGKDAPHVIGDGRHSIATLVDHKNQLRSLNPRLSSSPIRVDDYVVDNLARQGLDLQAVPGADEKIYLRREANIALGADTVDMTDRVSDAVKALAAKAVEAVPGLDWAGVDMILPDDPTLDGEAVVLEINTDPGIGGHHFPMRGTPRDVATAIWERAYAKQQALTSSLAYPRLPIPQRARRRVVARVRGTVQGVGFRKWVRRQARSMGLEGWVRNRRDGSLEACLDGYQASVEKMLGLMHFGPAGAVVENLSVTDRERPLSRAGFLLLKTR